MKKITPFVLILIFASSIVLAQQPEHINKQNREAVTPENRIETYVKRLDLLLDLTPEQEKAVADLQKKKMDEMLELREKTKTVKAEVNQLRTEKKAVNSNADEAVKEILTDEQRAKYEEWQSLRKEKNEMHRQHKKETIKIEGVE